MTCEQCEHWRKPINKPEFVHGEAGDPDRIEYGQCRRHAPRPQLELIVYSLKHGAPKFSQIEYVEGSDDLIAKWPRTDRLDWCGEFVRQA